MKKQKLLIKLEKINSRLRKEELKMKEVYLKLKENAENLLKSKMISDYECELKMEIYSSKIKTNKKNMVENGDPYYVSVAILTSMSEDDDFFNANWSEGDLDFNICYSMHDLLYHSTLTRKEIANTELIWFDIDFIYQFKISEFLKS